MKTKIFLVALCCAFTSTLLLGQQQRIAVKIETIDKFGQPAFFRPVSTTLKPVDTAACIQWLRDVYKASSSTTFKLLRQYKSNDRGIHQQYQQFTNGLQVIGGDVALHFKNNQLEYGNGYFVPINISTTKAVITLETAKAAAIAYSTTILKSDSRTGQKVLFTEMVYCTSPGSNACKLCYKILTEYEKPVFQPIYL